MTPHVPLNPSAAPRRVAQAVRRPRLWSIAACVPLLLCAACLTPLGEDLDTQDAALTGSIGGYSGDDETRVSTSREFYVELLSTGDTGAVMAGLSVERGFQSLEPGTEVTYRDGVGAAVLGCSGPANSYWTFDRDADRVTLRTEDVSDQIRRVSFVAEWDSGGTLRGSVDYLVQ